MAEFIDIVDLFATIAALVGVVWSVLKLRRIKSAVRGYLEIMPMKVITQKEYDALKRRGELDDETLYMTTE